MFGIKEKREARRAAKAVRSKRIQEESYELIMDRLNAMNTRERILLIAEIANLRVNPLHSADEKNKTIGYIRAAADYLIELETKNNPDTTRRVHEAQPGEALDIPELGIRIEADTLDRIAAAA